MNRENKMETKPKEEYLPCPLCRSNDLRIETYGIECRDCGIWYGNGSKSMDRGGLLKSWNTRKEKEDE